MAETGRKYFSVTFIIVFLVMLILSLSCVGIMVLRCDNAQVFDSVAWKGPSDGTVLLSQTYKTYEARKRMLPDLRRRYNLVGMSRNKIEHLLGKPERPGLFSKEPASLDWNYCLGPEEGFISIDHEWLTLKFSSDKVTQVMVTSD